MKKYIAKVNLRLNGKTIKAGTAVKLDDATADRIFQVLEPVINDAPSIDDVVAAIAAMPQNDEHYTKSGKPDANKLTDILNAEVSAKLRDAAWEVYQAQQQAQEDDTTTAE